MPKPFPHPKYRNYIINGYRKGRLNKYVLQSIADSFTYHIDIALRDNIPETLSAVKSLKIWRELKHGYPINPTAIWAISSEEIVPAKLEHWQPAKFYYPEDKIGRMLEVLILLSLKSLYDSYLHPQTYIRIDGNRGYGGVLFRSEVIRLKEAGRIHEMDTKLNNHINYLIESENFEEGKGGIRHTGDIPLRKNFLAHVSEIHNLICTGGKTGTHKKSGKLNETAWVLNVLPKNIRLFGEDGRPVESNLVIDMLSFFFPKGTLLNDFELKKYAELAKAEQPLRFSSDDEIKIMEPSEELKIEIEQRLEKQKAFDKDKVIGIIQFDDVFKEYCTDQFIDRPEITSRLTQLKKSCGSGTGYVLIIGESGSGKTAVVANFLNDRKKQDIHYFTSKGREDRSNPFNLLDHLYRSLSNRYEKPIEECGTNIRVALKRLKLRMQEISNTELSKDKSETIFIDGLDEFWEDPGYLGTISDMLSFELPEYFTFVLSSGMISNLMHFTAKDESNVVYIRRSKPETKESVEKFIRQGFSGIKIDETKLQLFIDKSQGNFQYAKFLIEEVQYDQALLQSYLEKLPCDLQELYEWKLNIIYQGLKTDRERNLHNKFMRMISLLREPHTPYEIFDYLKIDYADLSKILPPFERFFNLEIYRDRSECCWFHSSFSKYILDSKRCPNNEVKKLHKLIVNYTKIALSNDYDNRIREYALKHLTYHSYSCGELSVLLSYTKRKLLPIKAQAMSIEHTLPDISICFRAANEIGDPEQIIFYGSLFGIITNSFNRRLQSAEPVLLALRGEAGQALDSIGVAECKDSKAMAYASMIRFFQEHGSSQYANRCILQLQSIVSHDKLQYDTVHEIVRYLTDIHPQIALDSIKTSRVHLWDIELTALWLKKLLPKFDDSWNALTTNFGNDKYVLRNIVVEICCQLFGEEPLAGLLFLNRANEAGIDLSDLPLSVLQSSLTLIPLLTDVQIISSLELLLKTFQNYTPQHWRDIKESLHLLGETKLKMLLNTISENTNPPPCQYK